ncbi:L-lysine 6-transaminase [Desulfotalea psychrophila]|uniref:L-lysine-epsilon aminotransferase n=1 Tax=Desulfotalea psychrophila (strain LSv54 / DSM 12343) TaxID=177439 RepID=Q6AKR3_DESPS|nr:L-lysine 6-transaminase [Desulfotalea psychrophila]CAG37062.1 probable L-lysine aminotransferase [Desulfotalea psychrophila LSv54]
MTSRVSSTLARHILADGLPLVFDLKKSRGSQLVDKNSGDSFLDFFSMFASMAVGHNHPSLLAIQEQLGAVAIQKPSSSDVYTEEFAEFVDTFAQLAMPAFMPHAFFIEGGALAVENSLKTAFDWKTRLNQARGIATPKGTKIIHFQQAFHGRSGYTLSLTNTHDPRKTKFFPIMDWPRILNPKITFPLNRENLGQVIELEERALAQIHQVIGREGDDIAGLIIEPIQGEGGDNHFRPIFFRQLRKICDDHDILFIVDEIQSGMGITGKMWAHEHLEIEPDILCFGKKTQVCGIMASKRIDKVENNVFKESSRLNSTFGGNLVDMVRCTHILRIIEEERLVDNARVQGNHLLRQLEGLGEEFPHLVSNPRGRGLMCAFDLPSETMRNQFIEDMYKARVLLLGCGEKAIRFRPHLVVRREEIDEGMDIIRRTIKKTMG